MQLQDEAHYLFAPLPYRFVCLLHFILNYHILHNSLIHGTYRELIILSIPNIARFTYICPAGIIQRDSPKSKRNTVRVTLLVHRFHDFPIYAGFQVAFEGTCMNQLPLQP